MSAVYEQRRRSITKCVTWRIIAFLDTVLLSFIFTGSIGRALAIGGSEIVTKTTLYYLHERAWLYVAAWRDRIRPFGVQSFMHTNLYCVLKALSWRITGSIDTFFIALIVTGDPAASGAIGLAEVATKTVLYYLHERAWQNVEWGKEERPQKVSLTSISI